jgi:hypothetical protein
VRADVARAQERYDLRHVRLPLSLALHLARGLQRQATAELLSLASVRNIFDFFCPPYLSSFFPPFFSFFF